MLISIRKVFLNIKIFLSLLTVIIGINVLLLSYLSSSTERLEVLKNQHQLIDKILNTDQKDPKMASIMIAGAVAELELSVKLSDEKVIFDSYLISEQDRFKLTQSLKNSSKDFRDLALIWSESSHLSEVSNLNRLMNARIHYISSIDQLVNFYIQINSKIIMLIQNISILTLIFALFIFLIYRYRLNQIYDDIDQACSIDSDNEKKAIVTKEIEFVMKRLMRKTVQTVSNPNLTHPISSLNNEKGLFTAFNAKKLAKSGNTLFLSLFELDHYTTLVNTLTQEDINSIYKKIAEMIVLYEQPLDITAHLDNGRILFLLSRNSKQSALSDCEKIIHTVEESNFNTSQGKTKVTMSAGFILKTPAKSIDEAIEDTLKLIQKAQQNGGNRVAQLRDKADSYR